MKKTYSKPDIVFENFSLSTSVALNCAIKATGVPTGQGAVTVTIEGGMFDFVVFQNTTQGCQSFEEDGEWDGFCYHNPSDFNSLFVS